MTVVSVSTMAASATAQVDGVGDGAPIAPTGIGIASEAAGNLYIADAALNGNTADNDLRKVDTTGKMTAFGSGTARSPPSTARRPRFRRSVRTWPRSKWASSTSSTPLGEGIRAVDAHGAVTTFAGKLTMPGSTDGTGAEAQFGFFNGNSIGGGIATDGTNLYVADPGNHAIRQIVRDAEGHDDRRRHDGVDERHRHRRPIRQPRLGRTRETLHLRRG